MKKYLSVKVIFLIGFFVLITCVSAYATGKREIQKATKSNLKILDLLEKRGLKPKVLNEKTIVDIKDWPKDLVEGAAVKRLSGQEAGLTKEILPGVRFISFEKAKQMNTKEQNTGLFLVGIDFVPRELPEALKSLKYTLRKDGTLLDSNEEPILAMITSEVYLIQEKRMGKLLDVFVSEAHAASPFPWRCYSFTPWAIYHSGFHRWYEAKTWADTYGADSSGGCSSGSPHTKVDYIYTRAAVGGGGDSDHCFNCENEYSRDTWDVGYWWPAHGIPVTAHRAVYADGNFSFSRTAYLTW